MKPAPQIRTYSPQDEPAVIDLWNEVFPGGAAWNKPEDAIAVKMLVQPELFFVALDGEQVVGTVVAGFDGVRGWIHRLAVRPEFRRMGLASQLMGVAEEGLRNAGCPKVNLQVRSSNLGVLGFYAALGYDVEDRASLGKPIG